VEYKVFVHEVVTNGFNFLQDYQRVENELYEEKKKIELWKPINFVVSQMMINNGRYLHNRNIHSINKLRSYLMYHYLLPLFPDYEFLDHKEVASRFCERYKEGFHEVFNKSLQKILKKCPQISHENDKFRVTSRKIQTDLPNAKIAVRKKKINSKSKSNALQDDSTQNQVNSEFQSLRSQTSSSNSQQIQPSQNQASHTKPAPYRALTQEQKMKVEEELKEILNKNPMSLPDLSRNYKKNNIRFQEIYKVKIGSVLYSSRQFEIDQGSKIWTVSKCTHGNSKSVQKSTSNMNINTNMDI